jgi:hypothetical protein
MNRVQKIHLWIITGWFETKLNNILSFLIIKSMVEKGPPITDADADAQQVDNFLKL